MTRVTGAAGHTLRSLLLLAAVMLAFAGTATPARAAETTERPFVSCDDTARLASVIQAEAYSQPHEAHVAIAQIVAGEAERRGMTVCQLTERTWFVSVWQYAQRNPQSWTMRQFVQVQPWAYELAAATLAGQGEDATRGARHFDGAPCGVVLWTAGQIQFCE